MLQIFAHANLAHYPILVSVHSSQLSNVSENVLQTVCELISLDGSQPILDVRINDKLGQPQYLAHQVESITKARAFPFLRCQGFDRLQVEIEIQMQVSDILAMNQQVEHIVSLATNLQTRLYPIQLCRLEKLGSFK